MTPISILRFLPRFLILLCLVNSACATVPYRATTPTDFKGIEDASPLIRPNEPQIERGEPYVIIDGIGHLFFSLPEKLILWNWKMGNHDISPETEKAIKDYLALNQLHDVKVRLNDYAPLDEWRRLFNNEAIGPWWRYSIGALLNVVYTLLPGRIFGGDHYNTFTNTIHIYSDLPVVGLHEAGHSKDYAQRDLKALAALARMIPIVPLFQEEVASSEAISYATQYDMRYTLKSSYKLLYPAWGTYAGGEIGRALPGTSLISLIAVIPGHIIGRIKASEVEAPLCGDVAYEVTSFDPSKAIPVTPLMCAADSSDQAAPSDGKDKVEQRLQ